MKDKVILSQQEWQVLRKLNNEQLRLLSELKDTAQFQALKDLANIMIDIDKNDFFSINEGQIDPVKLATEHAYYRGSAARLVMIDRLIISSAAEILRRAETARKMKEKNV